MYRLERMLMSGKLDALMDKNRAIKMDADVRPVVTCANCKYNEREVTDLFGNNAIQCITGLTHGHDWFCADGERGEA
jgi:hypothetical protein